MNRILFSCIIILSISSVSASVVLNMTFDDSTGYICNTTFCQDNSPYSHNATSGAPTATYLTGANCFKNQCMGSGNNLYNISDFDEVKDNLYISTFAWVRSNTAVANGVILAHYDINAKRSWRMEQTGQGWFRVLLSGDGNTIHKQFNASSNQLPLNNTWTQVGFTWNGTELNLFINGENVSVTKTTDSALSTLYNSNQPMSIGGSHNALASASMFQGAIDEVLVFNRTLSLSEISSLYSSYFEESEEENTSLWYINFSSGDDSNSGHSPTNALKTITSLNTKSITPGDIIHFACNEVWHSATDGFLTPTSGNRTNNVTYTSYGCNTLDDRKPIILGSANKSGTGNWTQITGNYWISSDVSSLNLEVGNIYFNDIDNPLIGYKRSSFAALTTQGDFFYNSSDDKVYMYSSSNPGTYYTIIELALEKATIESSSKSYIKYEGLDLKFSGKGAFEAGEFGTASYQYYINNTVSYWGGAYQSGTLRYGNGIGFSLSTNNIYVSDNIVHDGWDACISPQSWNSAGQKFIRNHTYIRNIMYNCPYGFEYFNTYSTSVTENLNFSKNTIYNTGHGWPATQSANQGRNLLLTNTPTASTNIIFKDNIMYNSSHWTIDLSTGGTWNAAVIFDYNLYKLGGSATPIQWNGTSYSTLGAYQHATKQDNHSFVAEPLFIDVTNYNLQPAYNSPACGAASDGGDIGALPCAEDEEEPEEPIINYNMSIPFFTDFEPGMNESIWRTGYSLTNNCSGTVGAPDHFMEWTLEEQSAGYYSSSNRTFRTFDANAHSHYWLQTPAFTLNGSPANVSFWFRARAENNYDGMVIEYQINESGAWAEVHNESATVFFSQNPYTTYNGYGGTGTSGTSCRTKLFNNDKSNIINISIPSVAGNISFRFVGISDTNTDYADPDGFWIDDFNITYSPLGEPEPPTPPAIVYPTTIFADRALFIRSGVMWI